MRKVKGLLKIIFGRTAFVVWALLIQLAILYISFSWLSDYMIIIYGSFTFLSAIVLIYILNDETNASFKMAWIIPVLLIPVFGTLLYLFFNFQWQTEVMKRRFAKSEKEVTPIISQDESVLEKIRAQESGEIGIINYLRNSANFPVYENTSIEYFPLGEYKFKELLVQLKKAKKYIFLEYFIIREGYMWNTILDILQEKVKEGVEVRVMYDGMCSLTLLPYKYPKKILSYGIKCKVFSPIRPILSSYQNNRDHRKILIIDGHTAFTGGLNLADEYINEEIRFGHWKDTGIMLQGDAVKRFILMFLEMWNASENVPESYSPYLDDVYSDDVLKVIKSESYKVMQSGRNICEGGYVVPYSDRPYNGEDTGKQIYIDILNRAREYVHIMTPYLIIDDEMEGALIYAAKRGVEVIIMMPHIPDKLYAYLLARTYYKKLIENGVKIYEYTPGFVHAKSFVSDNERAVVGTFNLDFRSLYLHFECAAYIYKNPVIDIIEEDFQDTLKKCQEITVADCKKLAKWKKIAGQVLRLIAPLM